MPSQEEEQQDAQAVPTIRSEGERRSRHGQGPEQKKKKKKKSKKRSLVSRHPVIASLVSTSRAVRASPAARRASPAATPPAAAVIEPCRTPTYIDNDYVPHSESPEPMDEDDVEDDSEFEHNVDDEDYSDQDVEDDVEGDEQDVEDVEFATASASIRALTSKFRSEAWKEYVPLIVNGKVSKGRCKHCDKPISAKRGAGTSALLKHLDRCKKRDVALRIVQGLNSTLRSPDGRRLKNWNFDPVIARKELARMIALHGLPFILVEYDGFRRFVASLNPLFKPISRTTSRNDCVKAFNEQKVFLQEVNKDAKSRFSLTADMWTYVEFRLKQAFVNDPQPRIDRVRKVFRSLFTEYFAKLNGNNNFSQQTGQDHSQMDTTNDDIFDDWDNHLNEQRQGQVTTELDRYLSESPISRSGEFDILKWWSTNSATYPTIAAIARDVLAVPASTVASESAFSMGGRIVNDFRSRLNVESVEALICSQDWYRGSATDQRMSAITDLLDLQKDTEKDSPLA